MGVEARLLIGGSVHVRYNMVQVCKNMVSAIMFLKV